MSASVDAGDGLRPYRPWVLPAVWLPAVTAVVVLWLVGVVVPYFVNDLHELPLAEVASGAHDPKDLWPATASGGWALVRALAELASTPATGLLLLGSAAGSGMLIRQEWRSGTRLHRWLLAALLSTSALAAGVLLSPFGFALSAWALD